MATQWAGQVVEKSGSAPGAWKWPPLLESASCQSREATTSAYSSACAARWSLIRAATARPPSTAERAALDEVVLYVDDEQRAGHGWCSFGSSRR